MRNRANRARGREVIERPLACTETSGQGIEVQR